jgi:hypothetical protein
LEGRNEEEKDKLILSNDQVHLSDDLDWDLSLQLMKERENDLERLEEQIE